MAGEDGTMKHLRTFGGALALVALLGSLAGCNSIFGPGVNGSGTLKSERRPVSGFTEVVLSTVGTLTIEQTGTESLTIEGDDNIVPLITTVVQNSRLEIRHDPGTQSFTTNKPLAYRLTVQTLNALTVSGSGSATSPALHSSRLTLNDTGSGNIRLDGLQADVLMVTVSGSGTTTVSGETPTQAVRVSGSGSYAAADLDSTNANVIISGSGNATVRVSKVLMAVVSGSGSVTYLGNPTVTQQVSGSGRVVQGAQQ
jgi:Putative auto-transporter adhesin, head GIN domain